MKKILAALLIAGVAMCLGGCDEDVQTFRLFERAFQAYIGCDYGPDNEVLVGSAP